MQSKSLAAASLVFNDVTGTFSTPTFGPGALRQRARLAEKAKANAAFYAHLPAPADLEATRQVSRRHARKMAKRRYRLTGSNSRLVAVGL